MTATIFASSTTLADGTEQFLSSPNVPGEYTFALDRTNMVAGDVVEVRAYQIVASGGSPVLRSFWVLSGAVGTNQAMVFSVDRLLNGHTATNALRYSIKQTVGTYRNFPWSVTRMTDEADVTKWLGTAVATPAVAGRPSVDAIAISGSTTAADQVETNIPSLNYDLDLIAADAASASSSASAANAKFGGITTAAGNQLDDWLIAMSATAATAPAALSSAGFVPSTDSLEAIANSTPTDPLSSAVPGSYASGTAGYVLGNLQDRSVNVVTPFELASAKITLGFGEDYTSGSTNGLLTIDTTASINLLTAGGTIYFAVRRRNVTINSDPEFTLTGVASDADTFTVSVSNTYTRMLTPGTYLWTAWHVTALGVRTDIGHGNYVIEDLAQPTVS